MEDPNYQQPQAEGPSNPIGGSPKDVELPPSRWDSPKSPTQERPASPEPNCAICLGALENKSFTNSCMHKFCFVCLLEWSKVKAECPLCKNSFKSIIHNVRSMEDYDQYEVLRPAPPPDSSTSTPTWLSWSIAQMARYSDMHVIPSGRRPPARARRDRNIAGTSAYRRRIYDNDLWAQMQPDVSGRYRESSPQFYRQNPAVMNRLVPFLQRELNVLMHNSPEVPAVVETMLQKLRHHRITGRAFREHARLFVGPRHATHFCHELHAYATSPFDLIGYDRATEYEPNNNNTQSSELVEVIEDTPSSASTVGTDTDDSDSDVQWVSRPTPGSTPSFNVIITPEGESTSVEMRSLLRSSVLSRAPSPQPGPSGLSMIRVSSPPRHSRNCDSSVFVVDSSDSDECTIVGFVKPRHERTPELITLSSPERSPLFEPRSEPRSEPRYEPHSEPRVAILDATVTISSPVASEPNDSESIEHLVQDSESSDARNSSSMPTCIKGKRKAKRTRFNSSGSSSSSHTVRESSRSPSSLSSSSSDIWAPSQKQYKSYWNGGATASHSKKRKPCLRSIATRVPSSPRHRSRGHATVKYDYTSQSDEDEYGPSTSYKCSSMRPHRDRLTSVLQRTSSVSGKDIWRVNSASKTAAASSYDSDELPDSDDDYRSSSTQHSHKRKRSSRCSDSSDSDSRHKRKEHKSKKHKKKDRSKSKKSKKESTSKERRKRKHE